ncbi:MAG: acyl carrier protein [Gemmatimonadales bacterium]
MTREEKIFDFIKTTLVPNSDLAFDAEIDLLESGILDSVAMMELIVWLEDSFGIAIDTDDLVPENFASLGAMARYIEKTSAK